MKETNDEEAARRLLAPMKARRPALPPERAAVVWQRIQAERQRPVRSWWPAWVLAGAAAAAGVVVAVRPPDSQGLPSLAAPTVASAPPATLPAGAVTEGAGAVRVVKATSALTELALDRGRLTSRVPHLGPQQRYVVQTPAAEVEVRGTVFTVDHADGLTTVEVTEGRVEVRPTGDRGWRFVEAGGRWTVYPVTASGLQAARQAGDHAQAMEIEGIFADHGSGLERQNTLLRLARDLDGAQPPTALHLWRRLMRDGGPHAEEAHFRYAETLWRLGRLAEARAEGERFRAAFPMSHRGPAIATW